MLYGVIILILVFAALVVSICIRNARAVNELIGAALTEIGRYSPVIPASVYEYGNIKINKFMNFTVKHYRIKDIGNLSVLSVNAGVMQMSSIIISPYEKELPLMSADCIYSFFKRKAYLDFYDLVENSKSPEYKKILDSISDVLSKYTLLADDVRKPNWYDYLVSKGVHKNCSIKDDDVVTSMISECIDVLLEEARELPVLDSDKKKNKIKLTKDYSDGLINNGGISTDIFCKKLGQDKTRKFFDLVLFGTLEE